MDKCKKIGQKILKNGPNAIAISLNCIHESFDKSIESGLKYEVSAFANLFSTDETKEGLAALEGENSPTSDALLYSASLTLWHLGRYNSVQDAALVLRKILSCGKAVERFRKAAGAKNE